MKQKDYLKNVDCNAFRIRKTEKVLVRKQTQGS